MALSRGTPRADCLLSGLSSYGSAQSPLSVIPMVPPWAALNSSRYSLLAYACDRMTLCPALRRPHHERPDNSADEDTKGSAEGMSMLEEHSKWRNVHPWFCRRIALRGAHAIT